MCDMKKQPEYKMLSLSELKLDSDNPRLPKSMHGKTDKEILSFMLLDASLIELMLAIGENGFFPGEQLLVVKDIDGKFKVIEGNRRLSAVILLNQPELADVQKNKIHKVLDETKERPIDIPCLIFDAEDEIYNYLGYRHITGIKEWHLLEKARYLSQLRSNSFSNLSLDQASREIAKIIGSRKDYVRRILVGFEIYQVIEDEAFFRIRDLNDTTFYFNYIADSLNKANICNFLGIDLSDEKPNHELNRENLSKWTHWLFEKNDQNKTRLIGDSHDLNSLNTVLGNLEATKAFDEKGYSLERAKELTGELDEQFKIFIKKSIDSLESADRMVTRIKIFYEEIEDDLKNIRALSTKIARTIQDTEDEL
jgi:hypothetical protein